MDKLLTSHEVGSLLQISPSAVNKWVEAGHLHAFRTPGGHRRIRVGDLLTFLDSKKYPVPRALRSAHRRRLLIVDDDVLQLKALARALKSHGETIEVQTVNNGIDALVLVGAWKPHLVVLDVFMPELDGLEVCRRLHANPETAGVGIVVATGQLSREIETTALAAGARLAMQKPLDLKQLIAELGLQQVAA